MNRLRTGFHRIGIVGVVVALVLSALPIVAYFTNGRGESELFAFSAMLLVAGAIWYIACRALAWILSGFMAS